MCNQFTIMLDRFVFNRLQPILDRAIELLHSPPGTSDRGHISRSLYEAAEQLGELVDELDLMGVPPREIVDLLLSIRQATRIYAESFEKGAQGWESDDTGLIREAKAGTQEASAVLTSFFGWHLCS